MVKILHLKQSHSFSFTIVVWLTCVSHMCLYWKRARCNKRTLPIFLLMAPGFLVLTDYAICAIIIVCFKIKLRMRVSRDDYFLVFNDVNNMILYGFCSRCNISWWLTWWRWCIWSSFILCLLQLSGEKYIPFYGHAITLQRLTIFLSSLDYSITLILQIISTCFILMNPSPFTAYNDQLWVTFFPTSQSVSLKRSLMAIEVDTWQHKLMVYDIEQLWLRSPFFFTWPINFTLWIVNPCLSSNP